MFFIPIGTALIVRGVTTCMESLMKTLPVFVTFFILINTGMTNTELPAVTQKAGEINENLGSCGRA
jgi:hypothetical protein